MEYYLISFIITKLTFWNQLPKIKYIHHLNSEIPFQNLYMHVYQQLNNIFLFITFIDKDWSHINLNLADPVKNQFKMLITPN